MATATKPAGKELAKYDGNAACSLQQLGSMFNDALPRVRDALPPSMQKHAERFVRVALNEIQKNQAIAKCTGFSILRCVLEASVLGLEIGGPLGQAYMVPYGTTANFQIGYRGLIALAYRSGKVDKIFADVVREKDRFRMLSGTSAGIDHEKAHVNAGPIIGAYAVIVYKSGQIHFEYMARDEIEHHRKTYSKQPNSLLWTSAWNEAAKKTVTRKLLKYAPLGVDLPNEAEVEADDTPAPDAEVNPPAPQLPANPDEAGPETDEDGNPIGALFGGGDQVQMH